MPESTSTEARLSPADGLIAGLYASVPDPLGTESAIDAELIGLSRSRIAHLRGLEIPFYGRADVDEKYASRRVLDAIDPSWTHIVTTIPSAVIHQQLDPWHGLASIDESSRSAAVAKTKAAAALVKRLNDHAGRRAVVQVNLCSAPSSTRDADRSSAASLRRSLEDLSGADWDGATMNVEHCDSKTGRSIEKGFLSLRDEIEALRTVKAAGVRCGAVINWGRSAIEYRDPARVVEHIAIAAGSGLLNGIMFSGVSGSSDSAYGAWKDLHPSVAFDPEIDRYVPESLLTPAEMSTCLIAADSPEVVGFKIHLRPIDRYDVECAVEFNEAMARVLYRETQKVVA